MLYIKSLLLRAEINNAIPSLNKSGLAMLKPSIYALFLPLLLLLFSCSSNEDNTPQPTVQYTITFDSQGGSVVASLKVAQGQKATSPADPTRAGYTFVGWYKEVALTNAFDFSKEAITADIKLYAKWAEIPKFTVTFNSGEGSAVDALQVETGKSVAKPTDPTRTGYTFDGWYKEDTYTTLFKFTGETEADTITEAITLYAKWTEIPKFTVTFDSREGTSVDALQVETGKSIAKPTDPTRTGYTFDGWYKEDTYTTLFKFTGEAEADTVTEAITLYAKWTEIPKFTVTFNSGEGSAVDALQVETGKSVAKPTGPLRTGYTFDGWYKEDTYTTLFKFTGETEADTVTEAITLYAKWTEIPKFTVTFNSGEGSAVDALQVETGKSVAKPTDPTRDNYNFDGWYKEDTYTTLFKFTGETEADTVTEAITLYAKWTEIPKFTVTFNSGEGSAVDALQVETGKSVAKPTDPTRTGYTFEGWYKEDTYTTLFKFTGETEADTVTEVITLYAKWEAQSVASDLLSLALTLGSSQVGGVIEDTTVRFSVADKSFTTATIKTITLSDKATSEAKAEGVLTFTSSTSNLTVTAEDGTTTKTYTLKLVSNQPDLTNLSLTIAGATYPVTFPEGQTTTSLAVPDDTIVSATIESITVSAEASANPAEGSSLTFTDKQASLTVTAEDGTTTKTYTIALQNANLALSALTLTIGGVAIEAKIVGTDVYVGVADKTVVSTATIQQITVGDGATASPTNGETLSFIASNGEQTATITVTQGEATATYTVILQNTIRQITSFVFEVAQNEGRGLTEDITGVITETTEDVGAIILKVPAVESLRFVPTIDHNGERMTPATGEAQDFSTQVTYEVTSEYGELRTYTVTVTREDPFYTFVLNGGDYEGPNPFQIARGTIPTPPTPMRAGYRFVGWFTDVAMTIAFVERPEHLNRTLYAKWTEIPKFTVTFNSGEGSAVAALQVEEGKEVAKPVDPTRTGYDFVGWYKEDTYTTLFKFTGEAEADRVTEAITLYAKWTEIPKFTVTFNSGEGSAVDALQVEEGENVAKPTDPTRGGYTFDGWYKEDTYTTLFKFIGEAEADRVTEAITLYAKWTEIPKFTVTFNSGEGSAVVALQIEVGENVAKPTDPTRTGYVFDGWYKEATYTTLFKFTGEAEADRVTEAITLYAKWEVAQTVIFKRIGDLGPDVPLGTKEVASGKVLDLSIFDLSPYGLADLYKDEQGMQVFDRTTVIEADQTLYVKWEAVPRTNAELKKLINAGIAENGNNANLNYINTKYMTDMTEIFKGKNSFNGDISRWDVSKVTTMERMFHVEIDTDGAFNGDISDWNVSNVENMYEMFHGLNAFNRDISNWNVSKVSNMEGLFSRASAFNGDIGDWNVSSVINMVGMFYSDLSTDSAFNRDLNKWNVSNVKKMHFMFHAANAFNGNISDWNVSNVDNMTAMFKSATTFNQNLDNWVVSAGASMSEMFLNSGMDPLPTWYQE